MELYQKIRNIREDKDIKQKELAAYLHMQPNTYNAYEKGKRAYTAEHLKEICKILNVSADYLLDLEYEHPYKGLTPESIKMMESYKKALLAYQDAKKDL